MVLRHPPRSARSKISRTGFTPEKPGLPRRAIIRRAASVSSCSRSTSSMSVSGRRARQRRLASSLTAWALSISSTRGSSSVRSDFSNNSLIVYFSCKVRFLYGYCFLILPRLIQHKGQAQKGVHVDLPRQGRHPALLPGAETATPAPPDRGPCPRELASALRGSRTRPGTHSARPAPTACGAAPPGGSGCPVPAAGRNPGSPPAASPPPRENSGSSGSRGDTAPCPGHSPPDPSADASPQDKQHAFPLPFVEFPPDMTECINLPSPGGTYSSPGSGSPAPTGPG